MFVFCFMLWLKCDHFSKQEMPPPRPIRSTTDLSLAAYLVTADESPEPIPSVEHWPILQSTIQRYAIEIQIIDPREINHIMTDRLDFEQSLNQLRRRYNNLKDAPLVEDVERFLPASVVKDNISFNRGYRKYLIQRLAFEFDREQILQTAVKETDSLYEVWDSLRDARCGFYYIGVRRYALKRLQTLIGNDAYSRAELPNCVPIWQFNELK